MMLLVIIICRLILLVHPVENKIQQTRQQRTKLQSGRHDVVHQNKTVNASNAGINSEETREKVWGRAVCTKVFVER